jgi:ribosomal protein S27E
VPTKPWKSDGINEKNRGLAQFGGAGALGASGRRFESCIPDHFSKNLCSYYIYCTKNNMNKKTSIIWTESKENFQLRVNNCTSIAGIIRSFGLSISGAQHSRIKQRIAQDCIDISHIPLGIGASKGCKRLNKRIPLEEYLSNNRPIQSHDLKKRLLRENIFVYECSECKLGSLWNGKPISLQLDHINGNNCDNRLVNLRILCPNCHSQTPTFSGKHKAKKCLDCGGKISRPTSTRCKKCHIHNNRSQPPKPSKYIKFGLEKEELEMIIWKKPTCQIAKEFGVSDKAVEKRCKKLGVSKPPRGYWRKLETAK